MSDLKQNINAPDWKQEAGPIRALLNDPTISEIMVNRWDRIFIERNGKIEDTGAKFKSPEALAQCVQSICVYTGRELHRRSPYIDARLPDGSRINIVVPPIAFDGPAITIRKAIGALLDYRALVKIGTLTDKSVYFLNKAVDARQNIVTSGGTGSGKTTILSILSSFIDGKQRVVSLEDTVEMQLQVQNLVRLEIPPPVPSEARVTMGELLRNALRMRPDRILIGECRGAECLDMLMAMNTGHEGSMTTVHANTALDALRRMESMVVRAGVEAPLSMIQQDIANTIQFVIQIERAADGKRRVDEILEVRGRDQRDYVTVPIFKWNPEQGLSSTGEIPRFVGEAATTGISFPEDFFHPDFQVKFAAPA